MPEQIRQINSFAFLPLDGPINLKNPEVEFNLYMDYFHKETIEAIPVLRKYYFGVKVANSMRSVLPKFSLKEREYLGTTSMDPELCFVSANQALVKPDSLVLDPFVGTGSFLIAAAHLGAYCMGADIDGRQIRGKCIGFILSFALTYHV